MVDNTEDIILAKKYLRKLESSTDRGLSFELTLADMRRLYRRKTCAYTGVTFSNTKTKEPSPRSRTLERIDSSIGYTKDNTVVITHEANQFKSTWERGKGFDFNMAKKVVKAVDKLLTK